MTPILFAVALLVQQPSAGTVVGKVLDAGSGLPVSGVLVTLEPAAPGVPVCGAELLWGARHEFALTTSDLVDRRVRAGLVPAWRAAVVEAVEALGLDAATARTPGM